MAIPVATAAAIATNTKTVNRKGANQVPIRALGRCPSLLSDRLQEKQGKNEKTLAFFHFWYIIVFVKICLFKEQ
ncbi:MAG: hypothetical protein E7666_02990 [Ruminococcaceae bacterium]|nr:hypothetical protein [Oscillospiraceae bacterium]